MKDFPVVLEEWLDIMGWHVVFSSVCLYSIVRLEFQAMSNICVSCALFP